MKFLYLIIDLLTILIPFLFSFHSKLQFHKMWKPFFLSNSIVSVLFVIWDIYFVRRGIWGFNNHYILGVYVFNLPIEEIFFFICIPYACLFTYHCLNLFFQCKWEEKFEKIFILILSAALLSIGCIYFHKLYTCCSFISLGILILFLKYFANVNWLTNFMTVYTMLVVPFLLVNGVLTGTGIEHPVVWYNNAEIIGVRVFTIPVEDFIYGIELLLVNIFFYEFFKFYFHYNNLKIKSNISIPVKKNRKRNIS